MICPLFALLKALYFRTEQEMFGFPCDFGKIQTISVGIEQEKYSYFYESTG